MKCKLELSSARVTDLTSSAMSIFEIVKMAEIYSDMPWGEWGSSDLAAIHRLLTDLARKNTVKYRIEVLEDQIMGKSIVGQRIEVTVCGSKVHTAIWDERTEKALSLISRYGSTDGASHKQWTLDQVVRILTNCPEIELSALDCNEKLYNYTALGINTEYARWKKEHEQDGGHEWDIGIAP